MALRGKIILAAMEEWEADENAPNDMSFDEWAKKNRPDLVPLMDSLPPSDRPMPVIDSEEED